MHAEHAILVLAVSLAAGLILGYVTHRLRLSPILGYLLAGVAVAPKTPGFVADQETANLFSEIGVILLMFGVGLHFQLKDLLAVRRIAVPGAVGQILVATLLGMTAARIAGLEWPAAIVVGVAVSVASTVVLIRVLSDNNALSTTAGHIAVGWLIVEDLFTVLALVLLPAAASMLQGQGGGVGGILLSFCWAIAKIVVLGALVLWAGRHVIPRILEGVARTRTRELFTLAILAIVLCVAAGSAAVFGVSAALGAFLAGMVVGQSEVSHQAAADALPMRDAFAVLFFVSVGMLFDPRAIVAQPGLFVALLAVILVAKPLTAIAIMWALRYSPRAALTVAIGLAQIGEFSFILADLAAHEKINLLPAQAQSLLVVCSIVSIMLNPLLFRGIEPLERWLRRRGELWRWLSQRSELHAAQLRQHVAAPAEEGAKRALVVGYGPVGRTAAAILKDFGIQPVIIDLNVDSVASLNAMNEAAVYGDAARREILEAAGIRSAQYLLITVPELETRTVIALVARELNPRLKVFVRARYLDERAWLDEIGVTEASYEEAEAAIGLASLLLKEVGANQERIERELRKIRAKLALQPVSPEANEFPSEDTSTAETAAAGDTPEKR